MEYKVGDQVRLKGTDIGGTIVDIKRGQLVIDNGSSKMVEWPEFVSKIKGLTEEENELKFKVGDIVYSKTWQRNVVIHEILPDCVYKVGDLFSTNWFKEHGNNLCKELIRPTTEYTLPEGHIFKDENGNIINTTKIVLEKKKKEYPKTYEECCDVLSLGEDGRLYTKGYKASLIQNFQKLIICRNAYWKIAGEEMGLGKPWRPDWTNNNEVKFIIGVSENEIIKCYNGIAQYILAFPTEEMRDAFKENFNPDIEVCKELL